jgi:hypothetical protein
MKMARAAIFVSLALGMSLAPRAAAAQQAGPPPQIQTTQMFLMTWGGQKWDALRTVTADRVPVKIGSSTYMLEPGAEKSEVRLALPFRGLSTLRADGKITGVKVDEMAFKLGDTEMRGPGTIELAEDNGLFRVTGVIANLP